MDPGALTDRRPDRRADARGHGGELALSRRAAQAAFAVLALVAAAAPAAPPASPSAAPTPATFTWHLPRGFPTPAVPPDNPMSEAKVALGERLFFDTRLSVTGRYSCASCHDPARSFTDGRPVAVGATGEALPHNAMALVNVAYNISFGWMHPKVLSLEAQMLEPLLNEHPIELGLRGREAALCAQLAAEPAYAAAFAASFADAGGRPEAAPAVSFDHLVKAIAAFERTLIFGDSPFDHYVFGGEHGALTAAARRGMALFFSARVGCAGCHGGFNFAGNWRDAAGDTGPPSFAVNGTSVSAVRVPTLRNVALTAPYMHDGRFATLAAVLEHYSGIGQRALVHGGARPDRRLPREPLSGAERADLIAFLDSLSDESVVNRFRAARRSPQEIPNLDRAAGKIPLR